MEISRPVLARIVALCITSTSFSLFAAERLALTQMSFANPNNEFCWLNAHIFQRNRLFFCRKRSWWTLIYQIFHCKDEMIWICTS